MLSEAHFSKPRVRAGPRVRVGVDIHGNLLVHVTQLSLAYNINFYRAVWLQRSSFAQRTTTPSVTDPFWIMRIWYVNHN